jgi:hypothetical protein
MASLVLRGSRHPPPRLTGKAGEPRRQVLGYGAPRPALAAESAERATIPLVGCLGSCPAWCVRRGRRRPVTMTS